MIVKPVRGTDNPADIGTKILMRERFGELARQLRLEQQQQSVEDKIVEVVSDNGRVKDNICKVVSDNGRIDENIPEVENSDEEFDVNIIEEVGEQELVLHEAIHIACKARSAHSAERDRGGRGGF